MVSFPKARWAESSKRMDSIKAASLMGSTIPVVPKIEMPPCIPKRGLQVFCAIFSPSGTKIVTFALAPKTSVTAFSII